jgi:hypothetical protein
MSFASGTATARTLCNLAQTASAMDGLHVVVICRSYHARTQNEILELRFPIVEVRPLQPGLVTELLDRLNIEERPSELLTLGENVLHLSIIAELASDGRDVTNIYGEVELWKSYLNDIETREGRQALTKATDWAVDSLELSKREWYIAAADPATKRLIARGILVEVQPDIYAFRHDTLHDFLYAWHATRQGMGARAILEHIDSAFFPAISDWMLKIYSAENPKLALTFAEEVLCA